MIETVAPVRVETRYDRERRWGMDNVRGLMVGGALSLLFWVGVAILVAVL